MLDFGSARSGWNVEWNFLSAVVISFICEAVTLFFSSLLPLLLICVFQGLT